jgi:hypothetical protein
MPQQGGLAGPAGTSDDQRREMAGGPHDLFPEEARYESHVINTKYNLKYLNIRQA